MRIRQKFLIIEANNRNGSYISILVRGHLSLRKRVLFYLFLGGRGCLRKRVLFCKLVKMMKNMNDPLFASSLDEFHSLCSNPFHIVVVSPFNFVYMFAVVACVHESIRSVYIHIMAEFPFTMIHPFADLNQSGARNKLRPPR